MGQGQGFDASSQWTVRLNARQMSKERTTVESRCLNEIMSLLHEIQLDKGSRRHLSAPRPPQSFVRPKPSGRLINLRRPAVNGPRAPTGQDGVAGPVGAESGCD